MMENLTNQYSDDRDFKRMNLQEKISFRASSFKIPGGKPREEALADLKKRIIEKETRKVSTETTSFRMIWRVSSVAAGILILFGLWQLSSVVSETKVASGRGSHTNYILPDGSEVKLNSESRITFEKKDFGSDRQVALDGEAFFSVAKGSSFRIITPNGDIKVLGTSFNVYSRDNSFKVTCITGKVMVSCNDQSVTIEPGESAELSGGNLKGFHDARLQYITGWINGEFYFENTPLNLVFDEIERQFNVKFAKRERENRFFTGSFTNKDLEEALETVCIVMRLNYEIGENEKISISNRN
jgi:ferric-dicitrate binding protein FerR (iron transport regulator)